MKKAISFLTSCLLLFAMVMPVSAATLDINERANTASFEINDVIGYARSYGTRADTAITKIPISLNVGNGQGTNLIVTIDPTALRASGTLNFTVSGNFYRTSDDEIVTVYGLSGSFEYTGKDTKITGKSSYHTSTLKDWTGSSSTNTEYHPSLNHISVLEGIYTLYYKNQVNNDAWIRIAVSESGIYSVGGQYTSYTTN